MTDAEREALRTKVAQAIGEAFGGACMRQDGACSTDPDFCGCQRATDAALAVAEPMVREDEREACAMVADGSPYHGRYRTWPWWANPDGSQGNRENESDVVRHADSIAAAIRARGGA